jgi:glyoxylase-like metal-dependent hydrolase (beta-lactamase superfamily II)
MSMPEEILPDLYRVEIPLPNNPLKATNSYIIKEGPQTLIIDTGMNRQECLDAMSAALRELDVDLRQTDFFITHLHADHSGLVGELAAESSTVYFNRPDAAVIKQKDFWQELFFFAIQHGIAEDELKDALEKHPGNKYSPREEVALTIVEDGDTVTIGDYRLQCVETPGHTRGHMCLYEPDRKLLISGDHILGDITPNISSWDDTGNPLREYYQSLDRVYGMEIDLVLPGHRSIITDCRGRINELKQHHQDRLAEVSLILKQSAGPATAFQVASKMHWDIVADSWEAFPLMQKWFATGEAIAHLKHLEDDGLAQRKQFDGKILFMPA